jgi:phosphatidylserine/phosphatidylglycerophosphate/cardiolipin synthase-like enzyme
LAVFLIVILPAVSLGTALPATGTVEVFFSPPGGPTEAVVREIQGARSEILVQAYGFTSAPIAKALVTARKRGVRIEAVLDRSNATAKYSSATFLFNAGVPVWIDREHAIAHNKVMILDRKVLITGSFNFTKAAENKNAENLLVFHGNVPLVELYLKNYLVHRGHSESYGR